VTKETRIDPRTGERYTTTNESEDIQPYRSRFGGSIFGSAYQPEPDYGHDDEGGKLSKAFNKL